MSFAYYLSNRPDKTSLIYADVSCLFTEALSPAVFFDTRPLLNVNLDKKPLLASKFSCQSCTANLEMKTDCYKPGTKANVNMTTLLECFLNRIPFMHITITLFTFKMCLKCITKTVFHFLYKNKT